MIHRGYLSASGALSMSSKDLKYTPATKATFDSQRDFSRRTVMEQEEEKKEEEEPWLHNLFQLLLLVNLF